LVPSRELIALLILFMVCSYHRSMTLLLRKSSAQARIEGWDPSNWSDNDYAVVDDTIVGRIYREMILGKPKWRWFLQQIAEQVRGGRFRRPTKGWPIHWMRRKRPSPSVMRRWGGGNDRLNSRCHRLLENIGSVQRSARRWSYSPAIRKAQLRNYSCSLMGSIAI